MSDPERQVAAAPERLRRLYGLTPAESRVAALLVQGSTVEEAAEQLAVSLHTARNQLKSILQKTGSRRQSDCFE